MTNDLLVELSALFPSSLTRARAAEILTEIRMKRLDSASVHCTTLEASQRFFGAQECLMEIVETLLLTTEPTDTSGVDSDGGIF